MERRLGLKFTDGEELTIKPGPKQIGRKTAPFRSLATPNAPHQGLGASGLYAPRRN